MVTRGGLRKTRLFEPEAAYPITLEGIGQLARVVGEDLERDGRRRRATWSGSRTSS